MQEAVPCGVNETNCEDITDHLECGDDDQQVHRIATNVSLVRQDGVRQVNI
jgi:hypothetical protein